VSLLQKSKPMMDYYLGELEILSDDWANEHISRPLQKTINSILTYRADDQALLPRELATELQSALDSGRLSEASVSIVKRALELSVWATLVRQLEHPERAGSVSSNLNQMLGHAQQAESAGQRMVGCGGATSLFTASRTEAMSSVFGMSLRIETRYSFNRKMHCVICQKPPKKDPKTKKAEHKKWCGPCGICRGCDVKLKKSK
jgi:hypothetical protein